MDAIVPGRSQQPADASTGPLVTIVGLCFNNGEYVVRALESVRQQSYQSIDLVIVDDGSSDGSDETVAEWIERTGFPCSFLRNTTNRGIPSVLNGALARARGELVTWVADDLWEPRRLETVVSAFQRLPQDVGVLFSDALIIDASDRTTGALEPARTLEILRHPAAAQFQVPLGGCAVIGRELVREALFWRCFIPAPSATVRRRIYEVIGPYRTDVSIEDLDCWFRASAHFDFAYLREPLVRYRVHAGNYSAGISDGYLASLVSTLRRYRRGATMRSTRRAARRHVREEAYRVIFRLANLGRPGKALRVFIRYYLPNLQPSVTALKETVKAMGALVTARRPVER